MEGWKGKCGDRRETNWIRQRIHAMGGGGLEKLRGKKKNGLRRLPAAAFIRSTYQCAGMPSVGKAWEVTFVNGASEHHEHLEALQQQSYLIFCIQEIILRDCKTWAGVSERASSQAFTFLSSALLKRDIFIRKKSFLMLPTSRSGKRRPRNTPHSL